MVPRQAGLGRSFKGAGAYYLHDKEAETSERVAFTHTENIPTQHPEKALKWMAWTAINAEDLKRESGSSPTGQTCEKPVFTFSLAWHPEQNPHKWEMIGAGRRALIALGLAEHETLMVAHNDTDHPHIHLIVNTVHPETGYVNRLEFSKLKLSKWAQEYEREHGKIYCEQRVENNQQRQDGKFVKHKEPELDHKARISQLYHAADSGKAFQEALAEAGYKLAQGKRIVVIDQDGKIHSLSRQIGGVKAKDIRAKLADLELSSVDEARGQAGEQDGRQAETTRDRQTAEEQEPSHEDRQGQEEKEDQLVYFDRDQQDREWMESIIDAGIEAADREPEAAEPSSPATAVPGSITPVTPSAPPPLQTRPIRPKVLNALQDRHLAELGNFYEENQQARLRLAARLDEHYGDERKLRNDADHLAHVLNNSGRFHRLWLKLTRQIPGNAELDLQNMRRTLQNIEWRRSEAVRALEADIDRRRRDIEARQHHERQLDCNPRITDPHRSSDRAKAFRQAMEGEGYELPPVKRIVVLDRDDSSPREGVDLGEIDIPPETQSREDTENRHEELTQSRSDQQDVKEPQQKRKAQDAVGQEEKEERRIDRDQHEGVVEPTIEKAVDADDTKSLKLKIDARAEPLPQTLNALQDRHLDERGSFYEENNQLRSRFAGRLDEQYGEHERKLRDDAAQLENVLSNSGRFRRLWLRFTGQIPKNAERELQNMRLTLQNIEWRRSEAQQALEAEVAQRRQEFEARQARERLELQPAETLTEGVREKPVPDVEDCLDRDEDLGPSLN